MVYAPPPGTSSLPARPPPPASTSSGGGGGAGSSSGSGGGSRTGFKPFGTSAPPQLRPQSYTTSTSPSVTSSSYPPGSTAYAGGSTSANGFASAGHYGQRSHQYDASAQYSSAGPYASSAYSGYTASAAGVNSTSSSFSYNSPQSLQHHQLPQQQQQQGYGPQVSAYASSSYAAPQIQNPFLAPSAATGALNASEAAQIAEWQSAYNNTPVVGKDGKPVATVAEPTKPDAPVAAANVDKKKTVVRHGGGKKWTDDTLLDWDPSHLRLFVGNLAGETTDEYLFKAFGRWKSVQKARVIRDKRTTKSKGYGFVSFSDADDFFQAAKEMNGKYIQSHPVVIRKANTDIKVTNVKEKGNGAGGGGGNSGGGVSGKNNGNASNGAHAGKHKTKSGLQRGGAHEPVLGPVGGGGGGVTKPGQKTKNGLRLLG